MQVAKHSLRKESCSITSWLQSLAMVTQVFSQPRYRIFWRAGDYTAVKTAEPGVIVKKEHVASTLPFMQWQTDWTELVWHCKWGTRGLQPMQPSIVLSKSLQLAPGQPMQLLIRP